MALIMRKFLIILLLLFPLASCSLWDDPGYASRSGRLVKQYGGKKTRPDYAMRRSVILLRSGTKERLNLTYYKNGHYDSVALRKINKLFRDRLTGRIGKIDPELIDFMVDIRTRLGLPPTVEFTVLSGYRAPASNRKLRRSNKQVAKNSYHLRGWAVDFKIRHVNGKAIAEIAKTMQRGGVSYYPSSNHVHVDLGNIRTWKPK